jgi:hypothetical protein
VLQSQRQSLNPHLSSSMAFVVRSAMQSNGEISLSKFGK